MGIVKGQEKVHDCMLHGLEEGVFPGAVLWVVQRDQILFHRAFGSVGGDTRQQVTCSTLFDLASLTKPLALALSVMYLVQEKGLKLGSHLGAILPEFKDHPLGRATLEQLLRHQGGWAPYLPLYKTLSGDTPRKRMQELRRRLMDLVPHYPPGEQTVYSDLGFMALDWVLERWAGLTLDNFVLEHIYAPLGIVDLFFPGLESEIPLERFAATERCEWRKEVVQGVVHDENAFAVGGVAGHAGLFGTAGAVGQLLRELLALWHGRSTTRVLDPVIVRRFLRVPGPSARPLGFDCPDRIDSSAGRFFGPASVGHLGFTGTSFWMDLEKEIGIVLLTNRVYPTRANEKIRRFRPYIHNRVMEAFGFDFP